MIYKIHKHVCLKRKAMQLMHVDLNICFKIKRIQNKIYEEKRSKTFNRKQTTQNFSK